MDNTYRDITIGADPELFAWSNTDGQFKSVHALVPGTKSAPHPVDLGAVQVDGTAAEFNIDPATCESEFVTNIGTVKLQLNNMVGQAGLVLSATPVATFTPKYYASLPDVTKELGCDPDFNAWESGDENPTPEKIECMAAGGGHVHIGWNMDGIEFGDAMHELLSHQLVRQLDAVLGLASFEWDDDTTRRQLYGKAGSFRLKPYGVEYRVLSNAWVRDVKTQRRVFQLTQFAISRLNRGIAYENILGDLPRQLIDSGDSERALRVSNNIIRGRFDDAIPQRAGR